MKLQLNGIFEDSHWICTHALKHDQRVSATELNKKNFRNARTLEERQSEREARSANLRSAHSRGTPFREPDQSCWRNYRRRISRARHCRGRLRWLQGGEASASAPAPSQRRGERKRMRDDREEVDRREWEGWESQVMITSSPRLREREREQWRRSVKTTPLTAPSCLAREISLTRRKMHCRHTQRLRVKLVCVRDREWEGGGVEVGKDEMVLDIRCSENWIKVVLTRVWPSATAGICTIGRVCVAAKSKCLLVSYTPTLRKLIAKHLWMLGF